VRSVSVKVQFMGHPVREKLSTWSDTISEVSRAHICNGIMGSARPLYRDSGCAMPAYRRSTARPSVPLLKTDSRNFIGL
jgi:hypothetical protein